MRWDERFVDAAPLVIFGIDCDRTLAFVRGGESAGLFGSEPERLIGRPLAEICLNRSWRWLLEDVERAFGGEELARTAEIDDRSFAMSYAVPRDAAGRIVGVVGTAKDVTEGKRTEAVNTERATSLLRAALNATDDGMFTVDTTGKVGFVNQRFLDMWRVTEDVMRLPDFRQRMSFVIDQLKDPRGYEMRAKEYYEHPERETFDVLEFADGRVYERYSHPQWAEGLCVGRVLSFRDVTQRRAAERQRDRLFVEEQTARATADAAERRAAFLAETATLLASSLDYEQTIAAAAQRAVPVIADGCIIYTFEDTTIRLLESVHTDPKKREAALSLAPHCGPLRNGAASASALAGDEPLLVADVSEDWLDAQATDVEHRRLLRALGLRSLITVPLLARGNVVGAMMLLATEPGRSYGPSDLAFALDLARGVALAIDNARLYGQAERAIRARDEFLSIASHELRTPLTSLHLAVQYLLHVAPGVALGDVPQEIVEKLQTMERKSRQLGRLVSVLLDVSRCGSEMLALELSDDVNLTKVAGDVVSSLSEDIRRSKCEVRLETAGPVVGRWDRTRLEQVLSNLLSNALRHGAGKPITIRVEAGVGVAVLSVEDRGDGIAPELRTRIFEKFERGTLSRSHGGLGLGLYITQQIVRAHGGTIDVRSELGSGATFTVQLPRSR